MDADWSWEGDETGVSRSVQLAAKLPETVGGIRDLEVSVEDGGSGPVLVVALAEAGTEIIRKPFPGMGEDPDALRASFSKRSKMLKITVPVTAPPAGGGAGPAPPDPPVPSVESASAAAAVSPDASPSLEVQKPLQSRAAPLEAAAGLFGGGSGGAEEEVRGKMEAMLREAAGNWPDAAIRAGLLDFPVSYQAGGDVTAGGCSSGRHLTAARPLQPGTLVLLDAPLVAAVSDRYLGTLCCSCFKPIKAGDSSGDRHRGVACGDCGALTYCSEDCREHDRAFHSGAECSFLKMYLKKSPGAAVGGMRLVLRLLFARHSSGGAGGWEVFDALQEIPPPPVVSEPPSAFEEFMVERSRAFQSETATKARNFAGMMRSVGIPEGEIALVLSKLQANLIGICDSSGGNLGSGLYSRAWLFNHSCRPNVVLSFVGSRLEARTMSHVAEGEVLSIGYTELYETAEIRQRSLFSSKGFRCKCPRCEAFPHPGVGDGCIAAWKDPRRAGSFLYHPAEVEAMAPEGAQQEKHEVPDESTVKVMTEQNEVWRERLTRGLAYLSRAREVPESDSRHASALEQAQEVLEKVLHESSGRLHQHHAIRFAAHQGAADAAKALGRADACLSHAQSAADCMREHCCENHPGLARLLQLQGEMTMKQGIQQMKGSRMQAKLMLAGAVKQLQAAVGILQTVYGADHPDVADAQKPLEAANGLLQRLKSAAP